LKKKEGILVISYRLEKSAIEYGNKRGRLFMRMRGDEAKTAILKVLSESGRPLGASHIVSVLLSMGVDLQPRTVRHYLLKLDAQGFTKLVSRRMGREITERGREEVSRTNAMARMGIVAAKVDSLDTRCRLMLKMVKEQ
jgi:repressor of nif and glnA expression